MHRQVIALNNERPWLPYTLYVPYSTVVIERVDLGVHAVCCIDRSAAFVVGHHTPVFTKLLCGRLDVSIYGRPTAINESVDEHCYGVVLNIIIIIIIIII